MTWKSEVILFYSLQPITLPSLVIIKQRSFYNDRAVNTGKKTSNLTLTLTMWLENQEGLFPLKTTTVSSLVTIKLQGQTLLSGQHSVSRPSNRPNDMQNIYKSGGHKNRQARERKVVSVKLILNTGVKKKMQGLQMRDWKWIMLLFPCIFAN